MIKLKKSTSVIETVGNQTPARGRPRNKEADAEILNAALRLVQQTGFRSVTMEAIASEAGVARTTIYRRWSNKATIIMDAFLAEVGPTIPFPASMSALESIRLQMHSLARAFRGRPGVLIRSLLAEAQFDPELEVAFRERWIGKRRAAAKLVIEAAKRANDLPASTDPDTLLDALYGGLYYRLLIGSGPIDEAYVESVWNMVIKQNKRSGSKARPIGP